MKFKGFDLVNGIGHFKGFNFFFDFFNQFHKTYDLKRYFIDQNVFGIGFDEINRFINILGITHNVQKI